MLQDLDETLRQLLIAELPVKNDEVEISFDHPRREWSARLNGPAVNLFLYQVRENQTLRQQGWELAESGGPSGRLAHLKRPPLRVDCTYVLTTWARDAEDEHSLLARCLLALFRHPVLPENYLTGSLKQQPFEIPARLAQPDQLSNPAELWSAMDNFLRPSIAYVLTLALEPWVEVTSPLVRSLTMRTGQAASPPLSAGLQAGTQEEWSEIGGMIFKKGQPNSPLPGVNVAVKGTGLFTHSDERGRFRLGSLPLGEYTLIAWPAQGQPVEKAISLPASGEQCNLEI